MPSKIKLKRPSETESSGLNRVFISSVIGTAMFFALLAVFSVLVLKSDAFSQSMYMPLGLVSAAVSSFICGFVAVRPARKNGAVTGGLSGLFQALICAAAVFLINKNKCGTGVFILMAVIVVFSALGGISAVNMKVKKKY